jgi:hypothetical protein
MLPPYHAPAALSAPGPIRPVSAAGGLPSENMVARFAADLLD